ncbi:hypothetical protein B0H10DRAFT_752917 [Mycena sp. CBHHK59/15]|nr:hypothetical protein B0H10DRAFT_752917 [Mycena sp. CBHHK59/15]
MPEAQVLPLFAHEYEKYQHAYYKSKGRVPCGYLKLFPRTFAEGTKGKKGGKAYGTLTVDTTEFPPTLQGPADPAYTMNKFDALRTSKKDCEWKYLVDRIQKPGPVHVTFRGKSLAFTAGQHILVVHFGLEGDTRLIPCRDFEEIVSTCQPGPNPNGSKAEHLRSFPLPSRFITPGSQDSSRTINILAAIIMEEYLIIFSDFCRITRLHVIGAERTFDAADLEVDSLLWKTRLWICFPSGPDWIMETGATWMDAWRSSMLVQKKTTAMIDVLCQPLGPAAGVGAHLANDLLYLLAMHPDTPAYTFCCDEQSYNALRNFFPVFMAYWVSPEFKRRCGGTPNSVKPFGFNYTSNTNFIADVRVFRREDVRVPRDPYNFLSKSWPL